MNKYLRLIRFQAPIGTFLIYTPCIFGLLFGLLKTGRIIQISEFLKFFFGAFCARSAGCILNDIFDRKLDAYVTRTKSRPLVTGEISVKKAILIFILFSIGAFSVLRTLSVKSGLVCVVAALFVIIYPFCKRFTNFPQVLLGFLFNSGMLAGFLNISTSFDYTLLFPYLAFIFWTIIYDTIYAMQDINDDKMIGIKSTAIKFGSKYKLILHLLNTFYLLLLLTFWHVNALKNPLLVFIAFIINASVIKKSGEANFSKMFKLSLFSSIILCLGLFINIF